MTSNFVIPMQLVMNSANMKEGKAYYHAPTITVELLALLSLAFSALLLATGCSGPRHYWKGADIGWATECESRGLKFYNRGGQERECTALMKELGLEESLEDLGPNKKDPPSDTINATV